MDRQRQEPTIAPLLSISDLAERQSLATMSLHLVHEFAGPFDRTIGREDVAKVLAEPGDEVPDAPWRVEVSGFEWSDE